MPVLDFKELPPSNKATGSQDAFELFARDFLEYMGYETVSGPDRGQDGGRDLIVMETRKGIGGQSYVRWLVSCKHKAHSGNSVSVSDESDIKDRLGTFGCHGFIGFYSILASSGLSRKLEALSKSFEVQILDNERIERCLLQSSRGLELTKRYFPKSLRKWLNENPRPAKIFWEPQELRCLHCKKNLLDPEPSGIIVTWETIPKDRDSERTIFDVYWCCKGNCDRSLSIARDRHGAVDGWKDIPDVVIPTIYLQWILATFNELRSGTIYRDEAFERFRDFMYALFPYVSRPLTRAEKRRVKGLQMIPSYLGGLGQGF